MSDSSSMLALFIWLPLAIFAVVIMWKVFTKAGRPGWASIVPIYNIIVQLRIAGRPGWWILLYFLPIVNLVISIIVSIDTAKAFGRSAVFGIFGLVIFSIIGYGILAFGDDTYTQPSHS